MALTLKALKHFLINHGDQRASIWNNHQWLSLIFLNHLNTYVIRLWVYRDYKLFLTRSKPSLKNVMDFDTIKSKIIIKNHLYIFTKFWCDG